MSQGISAVTLQSGLKSMPEQCYIYIVHKNKYTDVLNIQGPGQDPQKFDRCIVVLENSSINERKVK